MSGSASSATRASSRRIEASRKALTTFTFPSDIAAQYPRRDSRVPLSMQSGGFSQVVREQSGAVSPFSRTGGAKATDGAFVRVCGAKATNPRGLRGAGLRGGNQLLAELLGRLDHVAEAWVDLVPAAGLEAAVGGDPE